MKFQAPVRCLRDRMLLFHRRDRTHRSKVGILELPWGMPGDIRMHYQRTHSLFAGHITRRWVDKIRRGTDMWRSRGKSLGSRQDPRSRLWGRSSEQGIRRSDRRSLQNLHEQRPRGRQREALFGGESSNLFGLGFDEVARIIRISCDQPR